jgi:hypothetical protein
MIDLLQKNTSSLHCAESLEGFCKDYFGVDLHVRKIIQSDLPAGEKLYTTVFMTDRNELYALCTDDDSLLLADIKLVIKSMGMEAEEFMPPNADANYFLRYGKKIFLAVFPDRKTVSMKDVKFYQTLAPYGPALIRISKIDKEIRQYNKIRQNWQAVFEFSYLRLRIQ